jgi:hypothetical protein
MKTGYVHFENRNFGYAGDRGTWARVNDDGSVTIKRAAKGLISSAYEEEISAFAEDCGINWDAIGCGMAASKAPGKVK